MVTLGQCCRCSQPAARTLLAESFCRTCSEAILIPIRARIESRTISLAYRSVKDGLLTPPATCALAELTEWGRSLRRAVNMQLLAHDEAAHAWREAVLSVESP